ncbi:hypothetical protein STIAU_5263, partial [Stigmatella aurantiaca DW4/3-1]
GMLRTGADFTDVFLDFSRV